MEVGEDRSSSRKRRRVITNSWKSKKSRHILLKSCQTRRSPVRFNGSVDIFSLLFPNPNDFLITNDGRQVRESEVRGKTIVLYMEPLTGHDPVEAETFHLIDTYNELWPRGGFEVVFAPVKRGDDHDYSEKRFNELFSQMPWPAVPFSNELTCDRIEHILSNKLACDSTEDASFLPCPWAIFSPTGEVLLRHERDAHLSGCPLSGCFFNYLGGADCPLSERQVWMLENEDRAALEPASVINLNQLLATPSRDFLLTKDGNKVPVSSLEDKVVGLYLCDDPTPRRMEVIKKVYREALDLGYNFEIVQINFHFPNLCKDQKLCIEDLPMEPCRENIPWLTLPFKDTCCRRVRRIFWMYINVVDMEDWWRGDRLVIINPPEPNICGVFFDTRGADIIQHFGIEAYPFTRRRVVELERARRRHELKLQNNLGPLLLRARSNRGGDDCGFDRVPVSRLCGKSVLVVLAAHRNYRYCHYLPSLKAKYLEQDDDDNKIKFEVVYVSTDSDGSSFEECTKSMPWLVHPYSLEFADRCISNLFNSPSPSKECAKRIGSYDLTNNLALEQQFNAALSRPYMVDPAIAAAAFTGDGERLAKTDFLACFQEYPFMRINKDKDILDDLHLGGSFSDVGVGPYLLTGD